MVHRVYCHIMDFFSGGGKWNLVAMGIGMTMSTRKKFEFLLFWWWFVDWISMLGEIVYCGWEYLDVYSTLVYLNNFMKCIFWNVSSKLCSSFLLFLGDICLLNDNKQIWSYLCKSFLFSWILISLHMMSKSKQIILEGKKKLHLKFEIDFDLAL